MAARVKLAEVEQAPQRLTEHWRRVISLRPPSARRHWLDKPEVLAVLGSRKVRALQRQVQRQIDECERRCCSGAWISAMRDRGDTCPFELMAMSRCRTRYGEAGLPSRRYTPTAAVALEDELDGMSVLEAELYSRPPSCSAMAIQRLETRKGRVLDQLPPIDVEAELREFLDEKVTA